MQARDWRDATPAGLPDTVTGCFDSLPVIAGLFEGPDHVIVAVNAAARAILGGRDVLGKPAAEGIPELATQEYLELLTRTYETGEPFTAVEWRNQLYAQDGEPNEIFMNMDLLPWRGSDGSIRGVVTQVTDVTQQVTERQAQEARAAELEGRYLAALDVVSTLQTELLTTRLPVLPGVRVAAHYLVAAEEQSAGGDWFDAVTLGDGRLALVVGDVVGHGVLASALMAQLRAVLVELLSSGTDLPEAIGRLDRFAARLGSTSASTLCVAILDPVSGELTYTTCGHPSPLLLQPDGTARFLEPTGGGPLTSGIVPEVATESVAAGEVLVLYSDGLVERAGKRLDENLERMSRIAAGALLNQVLPVGAPDSPVQRVCDQTVELMTRTGYADDVTVLAAQRRTRQVESLTHTLPADPAGLGDTRRVIRDWLEGLDVHPDDEMNLQLATTEVLSNSIEHAYVASRPQPIDLEIVLGTDGVVRCVVDDHGTWQPPDHADHDEERRRGLALVSQLSEDMRVERAESGTRVRFAQRLHGEAVLATPGITGSHPAPPEDARSLTVDEVESPVPHLRLRGPIDLATAPEADAALRRAARGGTISLAVDLDDVTLLASAGVQILVDVARLLERHGRQLRLIAGEGRPARQVLAIAGMPCSADLEAADQS